jgi:hypothetical protein
MSDHTKNGVFFKQERCTNKQTHSRRKNIPNNQNADANSNSETIIYLRL